MTELEKLNQELRDVRKRIGNQESEMLNFQGHNDVQLDELGRRLCGYITLSEHLQELIIKEEKGNGINWQQHLGRE